MKEISVAQLRQNPTAALLDVEAGATYLVTKHRRVVGKLVPVDDEGSTSGVTPAPDPGSSDLTGRPRRGLRTYEETQSLLAELASEW